MIQMLKSINKQRGFIAALFLFVIPILDSAESIAQTTRVQSNVAQPALPTIRLSAGMHVITAELASTPQTRERGLMFRQTLAPNHGMLFVFQATGQQCFWMMNTLIPLSIAFIKDDGTITNIADMQPLSKDNHCSTEPVRFALEMEQGWFAKRGITPGKQILGLPR